MATQKSISFSLPDLPVAACLAELRVALACGNCVLEAPPGSGKTTLVPLALLAEPWLAGRKIVMLEPRRPAARMAARRMADLLGERVGETVGYQVRLERCIGAHTRIEVLTEGLLVRRLQSDPALSGVGLVIFDEFHERSLSADLGLALCLDTCAGLRDDLRLLAMSASLDQAGLVDLLAARRVVAHGRAYPVTIEYLAREPAGSDPVAICVELVRRALDEYHGDILVFLPGRGEIARVHAQLREVREDGYEIHELYGDLSVAEQDKVLCPPSERRRRVILATDLAETSVTIEGVAVVVDSGLTRKPHFQPDSGLTRLETRFISKASALQRCGRAGRLGPGYCLRAWSEPRHARLDDWIEPEIMHADLGGLVLELAAWGVQEPGALRWPTPPPVAHWQQACEVLARLGALTSDGRLTVAGRAMADLPLSPRLAHMLTAAADPQLAADLAALLGERDPLRGRRGEATPVDLQLRCEMLAALRAGDPTHGVDKAALRRIDQLAHQFLRQSGGRRSVQGARVSPGACLALAYPDRVAQCRAGGGERYLLANGRGVRLPASDALYGQPLLVVADLDAGEREGRIWLAAALREEELIDLYPQQCLRSRDLYWDEQRQAVAARERLRFGCLILREQSAALVDDDDVATLLLAQLRRRGLALLGGQAEASQLRARIATLRLCGVEGDWPDMSEAALLASLEEWLPAWLQGVDSARGLMRLDLADILRGQLDWDTRTRLDELAPSHYTTPAGSRRGLEYSGAGTSPTLRVPLQEMFGAPQSPSVANGRVAIVLHLLSPAGRPLQITADLANFWADAYRDVKKEMRGRYPKHLWPDDPTQVQATRYTKRRLRTGN